VPATLSVHKRLLKIAEHRFQRKLRAQHAALAVQEEKAADLHQCQARSEAMLVRRSETQQALLSQADARVLHGLRITKLRSALVAGQKATHLAASVLMQAQADFLKAKAVTQAATKRVKKFEKLNEMQCTPLAEE
jgi:hypothetical protein